MSEAIRSFIAICVAEQAAERLSAAQEALRQAAPDLKWVDPAGFHLTLKFLGPVAPDRLRRTWQAVEEALDGTCGFCVRFAGVGAFPSLRRPRVVWAGVAAGAAELQSLAERVERACVALGFPPEDRPFQPHLTLGRARRPAPLPALAAAIDRLREEDFGESWVDRVLLMKSQLTPRGAIYDVLDQYFLAQEAPHG